MKAIATGIISFFGKKIEKRKFSAPPIYIGGCGRSGTTLLLSILSAHPQVFACKKELNLFENSSLENGKVKTPKFYRLYRTLLNSRIDQSAIRYLEKSPVNIYYTHIMEEIHTGNYKLVNIVRDGRDVVLSKHPRGKSEYWVSPERWVKDVQKGLEISRYPNVLTIKYEDLVTNFEDSINILCSFLDLPLHEQLVDWHKNAKVRENNALFNSIQEISSSSIGKYKNSQFNERVREFMETEGAAELLERYNYL